MTEHRTAYVTNSTADRFQFGLPEDVDGLNRAQVLVVGELALHINTAFEKGTITREDMIAALERLVWLLKSGRREIHDMPDGRQTIATWQRYLGQGGGE